MRFYVSRNVLVHPPELDPNIHGGANGTLIIRREDEGTVIGVGPNWLRVSFGEGEGGIFVTEGTEEEQHYLLATTLPGEEGFEYTKDMEKPGVLYKGLFCPIVYGADTELLVDVNDLRDMMSRRYVR